MSRRLILCVVAVLALSMAATIHAGGWAIVTLTEFPEQLVAGKTVAVTFSVRQHGMTLTNGLKPIVRAKGPGKSDLKIAALPSWRDGEYRFDLKLTEPGEWKITINSGFLSYMMGRPMGDDPAPSPAAGYVTLLLTVVSEGAAPVVNTERQKGERLFSAKGCIGCHTTGIASEVTAKRLTPDYVQRVLADPAGTLKRPKDLYPQMPDLKLKPSEIVALTAFLTDK